MRGDYCRDIRKNLEREKDHERDIAKERRRQLKADLEADNDAEDSWQRKLYAGRYEPDPIPPPLPLFPTRSSQNARFKVEHTYQPASSSTLQHVLCAVLYLTGVCRL